MIQVIRRLLEMAGFIKRIVDVVVAIFAIIVSSPVLLVASFLIGVTSPGPLLFRQKRLGKNGVIFTIYKLRTMVDQAWLKGDGLHVSFGDARITKVGSILRNMTTVFTN